MQLGSTFTPLLFGKSRGMGPEAHVSCKKVAETFANQSFHADIMTFCRSYEDA